MKTSTHVSTMLQFFFVPILGVLAILVLLFFILLPAEQDLDKVHRDIHSLKQTIQKRQDMVSLLKQRLISLRSAHREQKKDLKQLQARLTREQSTLGQITAYTLPEISPFPDAPDMLPQILKETVHKNGLHNVLLRMRDKEDSEKGKQVIARVTASGSLPRIRSYVISLLETSYVASVNQIKLESCKQGLCLDINFTVIL